MRAQEAAILRGLDEIEVACVKHDMPAMTAFWRQSFEEFFESECKQMVARVGRRGGKSTSTCRLSVATAIYGGFQIPPGDTAVIPFVSVDREEARDRIHTIRTILEAIGYEKPEVKASEITIKVDGRPIRFEVHTASIGGVSGFSSIMVVCDEVAKWKASGLTRNPAPEVLSSIRPTMAGVPGSKIYLLSSPLGSLDAHAEAFDVGNNASQRVFFAPTWIARPTLTEAETRVEEPNEDKWRREYGAIPLEGDVESLLSEDMLDRATRPGGDLPRERGVEYVGAMDAGYVADPWTFVLAGQRYFSPVIEDGHVVQAARQKRSIVLTREWIGTRASHNKPRAILEEIRDLCVEYGDCGVVADGYERFALQAIANEVGLEMSIHERGSARIMARYEGMRTRFANGEIEIPTNRHVRNDLLGVRQKLTANGFTIDLIERDGRHSDFAPAIAMALELCEVPAKEPARLGPGYLTQEWEDAQHAKRLARIARERVEGPVIVDDPTVYGEDPWP